MGQNIINFCIIAHIDHGKSTLADRLLEQTKTVSERDMRSQLLDDMDLEREKGITIKARAVRLSYTLNDIDYELNMIDTPGHVDFSYEVSRSLTACEGAILLIDATQGVQAQTLANVYLALEQDMTIIPVVNKIDLPGANVDTVLEEIEHYIGIDSREALLISAKTGKGVPALLERLIQEIPPPKKNIKNEPLRALIFDSSYDSYRGVILYVRVVDGQLLPQQNILMMMKNVSYEVIETGVFCPHMSPTDSLRPGQVGYVIANIKSVEHVSIGDTITTKKQSASSPLPGYKEAKPMVFSGIYPIDPEQYKDLRDAFDRLKLNDSSIYFEAEFSPAIGFGFRCGFLGLLHMDIIQERIRREYNIDVIATSPSVRYKIEFESGETLSIESPSEFPENQPVRQFLEPVVEALIIMPQEMIGSVMTLIKDRRGVFLKSDPLPLNRIALTSTLPLAEIVLDFYDKLKSLTKGYASFDYEVKSLQPTDLVKLNILVNKQPVDALSILVHRDFAQSRGRKLIEKFKELIPRQLFDIVIQASIGSKIIARVDIKALRKNVTAKCYGGDISRKRKLLEKQKEGKKKMKNIGNVSIPKEAFVAVLRVND